MSDLQLMRTFCELQYQNSTLFNDLNKLNDIKDKLKYFNFSNYDLQNKVLVLQQNSDMLSMNIYENRLILNCNYEQKIDFKNIATTNVPTVLRNLGIKKINRIGVVQFYGLEVKDLNEAEDKISRVFLNRELKLHELGKKLTPSLNIRFSIENNKFYKTNISISSGIMQTIQANMDNFQPQTSIITTKNYVDIQLDTFAMSIEANNIDKNFDEIWKIQNELRKKIIVLFEG